MSGPKAIKVTRMPLEKARRSNHVLVDQWLSEYARLESKVSMLNEQFGTLDEALLPAPISAAALRSELEQHFAPGRDGLSAVTRLRGLKQQFEQQITEGEARLRRTIGDLQRRFREAVAGTEAIEDEIAALRSWAENALPANCPAGECERFHGLWEELSGRLQVPGRVESALNRKAIGRLRDVEAVIAESCQAAIDIRKQLEEDVQNIHRRFVKAEVGGSVPTQKLSDYLRANAPVSATTDQRWTEKLDLLLAEMAVLQDTGGWVGILQRAEVVRNEGSAVRRRGLYEALVLECGSRLRRLREFRNWQTEVHHLIDSVAAYRGTAVDGIVVELENMERAGQVQDLSETRSRLEEAKAAAEKQSEREEKRKAILQTLGGLGYEVIEGM